MTTEFKDFNALKAIVESGDTASSAYWTARENYEDTLHAHCGLSLAKAREFASTMADPYEFNLVSYR